MLCILEHQHDYTSTVKNAESTYVNRTTTKNSTQRKHTEREKEREKRDETETELIKRRCFCNSPYACIGMTIIIVEEEAAASTTTTTAHKNIQLH